MPHNRHRLTSHDRPKSSNLTTNRQHSVEERQATNMNIGAAKDDQADIDTEILHLEQTLADLRRERAELDDYIEAERRSLSPIRRLPPEILSLIFVYIYPHILSPDDSALPDVRLYNFGPVHLMLVCQHWAHVVSQCPALWSGIVLTSYSPKSNTPALCRHLAMSGNHPLAIDFSDDGHHEYAVEAFGRHCTQWKTLSLAIPFDWLTSLLTNRMLPNLVSLDLSMPWRDGEVYSADELITDLYSPLNLASCPSLRILKLSECYTERPGLFLLPWDQLHHLTLDTVCIEAYISFLKLTPNLHSLSIGVVDGLNEDQDVPDNAATLSKLSVLDITFQNYWDLVGLFRTVSMPNVRNLTLRGNGLSASISSDDAQFQHLCTYLSALCIESFSLSEKELPGNFPERLFKALPRLRHLDWSIFHPYLSAYPGTGVQQISRYIETIYIREELPWDIHRSIGTGIETILGRHDTRLKTVKLDLGPSCQLRGDNSYITGWAKKCRDKGVDIELRTMQNVDL